ncbi:MinD/ParA family protein [Microbacterium atlanticum]|uniref:MinD/ParA family ATP-binding protein n=1 Tax=Microbacterium atlanticum TaxID=2782168 RepID=UPI003080C494
MTPDRNDHTHDEPENGVLSDTGSLDTTGLGILGGGTAQVNVELPTEADDDLDDDGVIDGEVPFIIEIPADADLPVDAPVESHDFGTHTTEAEIVDDSNDSLGWTIERGDYAPDPAAEDVTDGHVMEYEASVVSPDDEAGNDEAGSDAAWAGHEGESAEAADGSAWNHDPAAGSVAGDEAETFAGAASETFAGGVPVTAEVVEIAPDSGSAAEAHVDAGSAPETHEPEVFADATPGPASDNVSEPATPAGESAAEADSADPAAAESHFPDDFSDVEFAAGDFDGDFDPAEFDLALEDDGAEHVAPLALTPESGDDVIATDDTAEEPMTSTTPADDADDAAPDAVPAPPTPPVAHPIAPAAPPLPAPAATAATGPVPSRRRSHGTGAQPVVTGSAARAVERSQPRADVALTSKRLGELESGRETADLLTADRLLDPHQVVRPEPEGAWQHFVYSISGRRINLGDSKRARARKELDRRIAAPLPGGARFVPVLSRKGGVGKTTVTTLLGMALADARDDRVIAVDANPDRGTLAERITRESGKTVRDLVRVRGEVVGFNDLSNMVARDETRLDVVASDADPRVSEAFSDADYRDVASLAAHYYSVVLTDTGTGIVHSVMEATLDLADQLVIVAGLSVDEARLASETLTWLETNGHSEKVRNAVVVLNSARPGHPLVQLDELETHFRTRVREVVRIPYDAHIAAGSAIVFRELQPATRLAARRLAATVVEGLRSLASAA